MKCSRPGPSREEDVELGLPHKTLRLQYDDNGRERITRRKLIAVMDMTVWNDCEHTHTHTRRTQRHTEALHRHTVLV